MDPSNLLDYRKTKILKEYISLTNTVEAIEFLKKTTLEDAQFIDRVLTQLAKQGYRGEGSALPWDVVEKAINTLKEQGAFTQPPYLP